MPTLSATDASVNLKSSPITTHTGCDVAQLSAAVGAASSSIAAALETNAFNVAPPNIPPNVTPTRRVPCTRTPRMKFAKCGIWATKSFFLKPDKAGMYSKLSDTIYLDGKIDQCPRIENIDYVFHWTKMVGLPNHFDVTHLRTRVFKQDQEGMCLLRCAREDYDRVYPNQPPMYSPAASGNISRMKSLT